MQTVTTTRSPRAKKLIGVAVAVTGILGLTTTVSASGPRIQASTTDSSAQPPAVLVSTSPVRVLDTRPGTGPIGVPSAKKIGQGETINLKLAGEGLTIPANATSAILNVTIDEDATLQSFLTIWPTGEPRPTTSANNALPGLVAANSVIAKLGNGSISIFNQQGSVHLAIDLVGYLVPLSEVALPVGATGPAGAPGPAGTSTAAVGGPGLLGLPLTVLGTTAWTNVASFVAPTNGSFILQANAGITFDGGPLVALGAASTTLCRWSNNPGFDLGASITAGVEVIGIGVPGLDTANISVPGYIANATAGTVVNFECQVDQVLAVNSRTQVEAAVTAIQVTNITPG